MIDSSALLAFLKDERGADQARLAIRDSWTSAVNHAETLSKAANLGIDSAWADKQLAIAGLKVSPVDEFTARTVARLAWMANRNVSLADRFCIALAIEQRLPIVTGDRPWTQLNIPVEIRLIR